MHIYEVSDIRDVVIFWQVEEAKPHIAKAYLRYRKQGFR